MSAYTIGGARYAKGQMAVQIARGGENKGRAERLLCALNFRYTSRECSYIGSPSKVRKFEALYAAGWDASFFSRELEPPRAASC